MAEELAYALLTPYTIIKSRTGGVIGRLLSQATSQLVAARMYTPSDAFVDAYAESVKGDPGMDENMKSTVIRYLDENLRPQNRLGRENRTIALLFRGENAVDQLKHEVVGAHTPHPHGDTIRGTYGDFIRYESGEVSYFEPAVLAATGVDMANERLKILADFAETDGGVVDHAVKYPDESNVETTLVMLKPDLFADRSAKPGNIIDMFSGTGLYIVGTRVLHLSVDQGIEFYGPLRQEFVEKLKFLVEGNIRDGIDETFDFDVADGEVSQMADVLKDRFAECEFNKIVNYMTGCDPAAVTGAEERKAPGKSKCLAFLYQGENAIEKIREKLGPTDPSKAPGGSVRRDYGGDLMRNGAHASDAPESAVRERKIVRLSGGEPSQMKELIESYLAGGF